MKWLTVFALLLFLFAFTEGRGQNIKRTLKKHIWKPSSLLEHLKEGDTLILVNRTHSIFHETGSIAFRKNHQFDTCVTKRVCRFSKRSSMLKRINYWSRKGDWFYKDYLRVCYREDKNICFKTIAITEDKISLVVKEVQ